MNYRVYPKKMLFNMLKKAVDMNSALEHDLSNCKSQITVLTSNAKKWAAKFRSSHVREIEKHVLEMELEIEGIKQQTRSEIDRLKNEKMVLIGLLNEARYDNSDHFGVSDGTGVEFDLELTVGSDLTGLTGTERLELDRDIEVVWNKIKKSRRNDDVIARSESGI